MPAFALDLFISAYNELAGQLTSLKAAVYAITNPGLSIAPEPLMLSVQPYGRANYMALLSNGRQLNVNSFLSPFGGGLPEMVRQIGIWENKLASLSYPTPMSWDNWGHKYVPKAFTDVLNLGPDDVKYINTTLDDHSKYYDQEAVLLDTKLTQAMLWDYVQKMYEFIHRESEKARGNDPGPEVLPMPDFTPGSGYCTPWPFGPDVTPLRGEQGNLVFKPIGA
jgi:hypothetical protein